MVAGSVIDLQEFLAGYEAFAAGDVKSALSLLRPDIEVVVHTERPDIGSEVYHGHEGFLSNLSEITEVFDDFKVEVEKADVASERIMVTVRVTGRGTTSGAGIDTHMFHVWTVRDGLASRLEIYSDRERAREAFGAG
jgi:ketosteroid isomerase-like protein